MELKFQTVLKPDKVYYLLIVPYGIEIRKQLAITDLSYLLIVPYGIEINQKEQSQHFQ